MITDHCRQDIMVFLRRKGAKHGVEEDVYWQAMAVFVVNVQQRKYESHNKICQYLQGIAFNILRNELRKESIRKGHEERQHQQPDLVVKDPEQLFLDKEAKSRLFQKLEQLKPGCIEVLRLWAIGFNMTEIAEKMGFKNSQVAMNKKSKCLKEAAVLLGKTT
ncbi:MAG: hypothetical protein AAF206_23650 [Bacteroidota bacterium]